MNKTKHILNRLKQTDMNDYNKQQVLSAFADFIAASSNLNNVWTDVNDDGNMFSEAYPFNMSFDELLPDIFEWYHSSIKSIGYRVMPSQWHKDVAVQYAESHGIKTYQHGDRYFLENVYAPAKVCIEESPVFDCYLLLMDDWNGWKKPFFTPEMAQEVVKDYNDRTGLFFDGDDIVYISPNSDEEERVKLETIIVDGKEVQVYDLSLGWVWSIANEEEDGR